MERLKLNILEKFKLTLIALLLSVPYTSSGQDSFSMIVEEVLNNNAGARGARLEMESGIKSTRTGIFPVNPELEAGFLRNSTDPTAPRRDFAITQAIDFPTSYFQRKKIADYRSQYHAKSYEGYLRSLEIDIRILCAELVYLNRMTEELEKRVKNAELLRYSYLTMFDKNDATVIDRNKAESYLIDLRSELSKYRAERDEIMTTLTALNNGVKPDIANIDYPVFQLPDDFNSWFTSAIANHPELAISKIEEEESKMAVKLSRSESLPRLSAGYMSESVVSESFRGVTMGISLPLWENRNRTSAAILHSQAATALLEESEKKIESKLKNTFRRASSLNEMATMLREAITDFSNEAFLNTALDAGGISLLTYLKEIEYQYDIVDKLALVERELNLIMPEITTLTPIDF